MIVITNPRRFIGLLITFLILVAAGAALWLFLAQASIQKSGTFAIETGQSMRGVIVGLAEEGFITRPWPWRWAAWRQDAAARLQAGTYQLEVGESAATVIARMVNGDTTPDEITLTFPEGFTLEQMAERTAARGIGTEEEFIAAAEPSAFAEQYLWLKDLPEGRTLEGYLFPDTYHVFADDTPRDVVTRMLATFDRKVVGAGLLVNSERSLDETVIMASIVEREVISDDDMALVSGVLWKRNDEGIGLDADATVRYALKKWDEPLTIQDLASESPYNTRKWRGLPPGPISNPGLRALAAAANPEESEFYYYLSSRDGETIFATTNEEHNANKVEYLN